MSAAGQADDLEYQRKMAEYEAAVAARAAKKATKAKAAAAKKAKKKAAKQAKKGGGGTSALGTSVELAAPAQGVGDRARESSIAEVVAQTRSTRVCGHDCDSRSVSLVRYTVSFTLLLLIGGAIFFALEEPQELQRLKDAKTMTEAARARTLDLLGGNQTLFDLIRDAGGADAFAEADMTDNWTYGSSCLFAFTIVTTIGYGTFAPSTVAGQIFLVFYALLGIPTATMTLVYLADRALGLFTWLFSLGTDKILDAFRQFDDDNSGELDLDEFRAAVLSLGIELTSGQFRELINKVDADGSGQIDQKEFEAAVELLHADVTEAAGRKNRIKIVGTTIVVWLLLGILMFCLAEGWNFETAMYFTFVTLTTVGLGDFFPSTPGGRVVLIIFAMVGLGLIATLLTLIEQFVSDLEKHRKAALEKARQAAIKAREAAGASTAGGSKMVGVFAGSAKRIINAGRVFRSRRKSSRELMAEEEAKKKEEEEESREEGGLGIAASEVAVVATE